MIVIYKSEGFADDVLTDLEDIKFTVMNFYCCDLGQQQKFMEIYGNILENIFLDVVQFRSSLQNN